MGEVITVDFKRRARTVPNPVFERFLQLLVKYGVAEDDIAEVADAVRDYEYYKTCEPDIRKIADVWIHHSKNL